MTLEEELSRPAGPAAPKVLRLLYFVGAGLICTAAINKWREIERNSIEKQQQQTLLAQTSSNAVVHKDLK